MCGREGSCHLGVCLSLGRACGGCCVHPGAPEPLPAPPPRACTHLGLDALEGLLQQQREASHLTLEPIVVAGQGPQRWLQRQQVGPDACGDTKG